MNEHLYVRDLHIKFEVKWSSFALVEKSLPLTIAW